MRQIYRDCVSGLITSKDDRILLGMKDPHGGGVYADCWHLPGGGVDEGESHLAALAREMREEVGLNITQADVMLADDKGRGSAQKTLKSTNEIVMCHMKFFVYRVSFPLPASQIQARAGDDLQKIIWARRSEIDGLKLAPPSISLFKRLGLGQK